MMSKQRWVFLSDPESYHFDTLFKKKREVWDGVHGASAQKFLRESVRKGDLVICYHTSPEKKMYGLAEVLTDGYPDPGDPDHKAFVVDLKPVTKFAHQISLEELKSNQALSQMKFVKMGRLAVSLVTDEEWKEIERLSKSG